MKLSFTAFCVYVVIAAALLRVPVIGKYLAVTNTLVHEVGHAIVTKLTGGHVMKIKLFANTEGVAQSRNHWLGSLLTTAAGYPFASAIAFLCVYFLNRGEYMYVMVMLASILIVSTILWIRNIYGLIWVVSISALFVGLYNLHNDVLTMHVLLILTAILLVESLYSAFDILCLSVKSPSNAGDATGMARATFIMPAFVWGVVFFAQAVFFVCMSVRLVLPQ